MSAEYPFYISEASSSYEITMKAQGFSWWAQLKEGNDTFYRLLGWALLHHCRYDSSQHRRWKSAIDSVAAHTSDNALQGQMDQTEIGEYWDTVKQCTLDEAKKFMQRSDTNPGINKVLAGHMPNMKDSNTLSILTHGLSIVLVWYEVLQGQFTTEWHYLETSEPERIGLPLFYICMGRDSGKLYAFLHDGIWTNVGEEGFPHYTQAARFRKPLVVGQNLVEGSTENGLALVLNLLMGALTETPPHLLPKSERRQLYVIATNWHLIRPMIQQVPLAQSFDFDKFSVFLDRIRTAPEPADHDISSCQSHPPRELLPCGYHKDCLTNLLREQQYMGQPLQLPGGGSVSQDLLQEVAPDLRAVH